jgi:16S rRNA (cytidine1402-2'-O)-methyltransferase
MSDPGTLYVVGTPIGNLGDLTRRAVETIASVDIVAAEDTRRTRALLTHLGIMGKRVVRLDAHASDADLETLVDRIEQGESVALVTDAGMPGVSDPGARLVRVASARGALTRVVPGASALTAAVALSGLVEGSFWFLGFLPRKGKARRDSLDRIADSAQPVVLFEAPSRIRATLEELAERMPMRPAFIARELTKLHEETERGTLAELAAIDRERRGELTLVLGEAAREAQPREEPSAELDARIEGELASGRSVRSVVDALSHDRGQSRRQLYARVQAIRDRKR